MDRTVSGIHHITAITGDPEENIWFYRGLLGLRMVKVTVNFDDPGSCHFYYGDGCGTPGTIITFFAWPGARRGRHGNGQVTSTSFAIPRGSAQFWKDRLAAHGRVAPSIERFGEMVIPFFDKDGLGLELVETDSIEVAAPTWTGSDIPKECAIRGFHSATLSETGYERTADLLISTMGFRLVGNEQNRFRYEVAAGGATRTVDLICAPGAAEGRVSVGTVHHIAWRTENDAQQLEWHRELRRLGYNLTPVMDRVCFHSIYYREPGGILLEIATDPPGFTVDEPLDALGTALKLPPWLEPHRDRIEATLPPVRSLHQGVPS